MGGKLAGTFGVLLELVGYLAVASLVALFFLLFWALGVLRAGGLG